MFRSSCSMECTLRDFCHPIAQLRLAGRGNDCSSPLLPANIPQTFLSSPVTVKALNSSQFLEQFCSVLGKRALAWTPPHSPSPFRISHEDVCRSCVLQAE